MWEMPQIREKRTCTVTEICLKNFEWNGQVCSGAGGYTNRCRFVCLCELVFSSLSVNMLADVGYIPVERWAGILKIRSFSSSDSDSSVKARGVNSPVEIKPLSHLTQTNGSEGGRRGFCRDVFCCCSRDSLLSQVGLTAHASDLPVVAF